MSPLDRVWKPGFSPDTCTSVFSALETFVIIALYKLTFTIPYHTIKLTYVGFRAHVKTASRIVSHRNQRSDPKQSEKHENKLSARTLLFVSTIIGMIVFVMCTLQDGRRLNDRYETGNSSVRENVCNNSEKCRKNSCFWILKNAKKRTETYVQSQRPLNHSAVFKTRLPEVSTGNVINIKHLCSEMRTQSWHAVKERSQPPEMNWTDLRQVIVIIIIIIFLNIYPRLYRSPGLKTTS